MPINAFKCRNTIFENAAEIYEIDPKTEIHQALYSIFVNLNRARQGILQNSGKIGSSSSIRQ